MLNQSKSVRSEDRLALYDVRVCMIFSLRDSHLLDLFNCRRRGDGIVSKIIDRGDVDTSSTHI